MRMRAGTSGFSYKAWKGPFYPEKLADRDMLRFYAEHLSTVEINSTFYRMPKASMLEGWKEKVPDDFVFVLKASRRITHHARLKEGAFDSVEYLWDTASVLGDRLGPILFQLPPNLKKDVERLNRFLEALPNGLQGAFEFRNESWMDDDVFEALRRGGHALCLAETDEGGAPELVATADWGYLRLRREEYSEEALRGWKSWIEDQPWNEAFVFFKHEDEGAAPKLAKRLLQLD